MPRHADLEPVADWEDAEEDERLTLEHQAVQLRVRLGGRRDDRHGLAAEDEDPSGMSGEVFDR